jgi:uncharacterized membrane protein YhiD involved in acid resistance
MQDLVEMTSAPTPDEVAAITLNPLATLCLATAFGLVVSILHLLAHRERPIYSLWRPLLLIAPLIAMSTMAVGSNLAAAFTLFGTLAIVRFRTAIRDPLDAAFVIFSVIIGLALGNQSLQVAVVGTSVIAALILILLAVNRLVPSENQSTLRLRIRGLETPDTVWRSTLEADGIKVRIESCAHDRMKGEQSIKIRMSGISGDRWPRLLSRLLAIPEVEHAAGRTDDS